MTDQVELCGTAEATDELLLRARKRADNVLETLPYVPGSALRGALAQRWLAGAQPDAAFRDIFQSGKVRFEHAYPLADDAETVPAPLTFVACKLAPLARGHTGRDLLLEDEIHHCEAPEHEGRPTALKRLRGFVTRPTGGRGSVVREDAALVSRQRVGTKDDGSGRVRGPEDGDAGGALFEERLIAAGTRFGVRITGPRALIDELMARSNVPVDGSLSLSVGRSRTVRGELTIRWHQPRAAPTGTPPAGSSRHALLLTSDLVLLDGYQRNITSLDSPAVMAGEVLGCEPADVTVHRHALRTAAVGGWDALHRISKPVDTAVAAGSVVLFSAPAAAVRSLAERAGLGWRQAEGCGGFLLDAAIHQTAEWSRWPTPHPPDPDAARARIARRAHQLAESLRQENVSPSLWHGILQTVRQGQSPQQPDDTRDSTDPAEEPPAQEREDEARAQAHSSRGARAGQAQRSRRRQAITLYERAVDDDGLVSRAEQVQLAEDVAHELDLHQKRTRRKGRR